MKKLILNQLAIASALSISASAAVVVGDWTVMDNSMADDGTATFATTGTWGSTAGGLGTADDGWATTYLFNDNGTATWTFLGLADGTYEVAASYREFTNRPTDAIYDVGGSTVTVNQTVAPDGIPTLNDGIIDVHFQSLGTFEVTGGAGQLILTVSEGTPADSEFLIADAAAIRAVPEPSSAALLGLGGLALILRRRK